MSQIINLPRDTTLQELVAIQKANLLSCGNNAAIDNYYNSRVRSCSTAAQVDALFVEWWNSQWVEGTTSRNELLVRWFGNVLDDDKEYGVKLPLFSTSNSASGVKLYDNAALVAVPSTEAAAGRDDYACLPQFWCLEVSMERNADGTHTIYAVEHIDDLADVRSGEHLCQVLQKNTYTREWLEGGYHFYNQRCHPATGYESWPQGSSKTGVMYPYMANPKYYAGKDSNGMITCGTGLAPLNWYSHSSGVSEWRNRGSQYSGAAGNLLKWQLAMMWVKYAVKGNSGTIEGCSSYNYQYRAAVSETGVRRIILTAAQASNLFVGSSVELGAFNGSSYDRNSSQNYNIDRNVLITAIEDVTIDSTAYKAVYVATSSTFDTTVDVTMISTMPYYSGWNDNVQGNDGSRYSATSGKEPGLIQKTEFMNGSYIIISDELWKWGKDGSGNFTFDCYTCHDQSKVSTSITADYTKQEDLTLVFPDSVGAWWYVEDIAVANDKGVLWPSKVSTAAGSGTGCKAGFYVGTADDGVRAAWCCCSLNGAGGAGLPARHSYNGVADTYWYGSIGCPSGISG